jgi:hypothetical protein
MAQGTRWSSSSATNAERKERTAPLGDEVGAGCAGRGLHEAAKGTFKELHGSATITGVLFFDFAHHQRGKAPNVAELHPVLRFFDADCSRA